MDLWLTGLSHFRCTTLLHKAKLECLFSSGTFESSCSVSPIVLLRRGAERIVLVFVHCFQSYSDVLSCLPISSGYFIHDLLDMIFNQKISQSWELVFHHLVITCFGISALSFRYVGFAVVALLVEINSIFLHLRQMLRMSGLAKSTVYRLNSMVNLGTYVVFRISTLAWMTRWLVLNRSLIPLLIYTVGSVGMAIMTAMNIVLFYRLLRSDFLISGRETRREKEM
uniref:TLC domain containing 2 n=1 Tax=Paramormyrops kingsleyae TaxID=1676925 RepID=A0A3B3RRW2_9TELE